MLVLKKSTYAVRHANFSAQFNLINFDGLRWLQSQNARMSTAFATPDSNSFAISPCDLEHQVAGRSLQLRERSIVLPRHA